MQPQPWQSQPNFQSNSTMQSHQTNPLQDTFRLIAQTRRQVAHATEQATAAVRSFYKNPEDLATFIERHGTPVIYLPVHWIPLLSLKLLGFELGYIPVPTEPHLRHRFDTLCRLFDIEASKPNCTLSHGVFIVTKPLFNIGFMAYQLHHWFACRNGMTGYESKDLKRYRHFWEKKQGIIGPEVMRMTEAEVRSLKNAINRDLEALKFLRQITEEIFVPANQANALAQNKSASA
ncbi:MAG: hypothetical protein KTR14_09455 [Vampirovibrio sp.]|nr:hypothetical protein [Vampirovibrio sp.]